MRKYNKKTEIIDEFGQKFVLSITFNRREQEWIRLTNSADCIQFNAGRNMCSAILNPFGKSDIWGKMQGRIPAKNVIPTEKLLERIVPGGYIEGNTLLVPKETNVGHIIGRDGKSIKALAKALGFSYLKIQRK